MYGGKRLAHTFVLKTAFPIALGFQFLQYAINTAHVLCNVPPDISHCQIVSLH